MGGRYFDSKDNIVVEKSRKLLRYRYRWTIHLLFFFATFIVPIGVAYLVAETQMAWYLYRTGELRSAQGDNYLLVFEALLMAPFSILITFIIMVFWWWMIMQTKEKD